MGFPDRFWKSLLKQEDILRDDWQLVLTVSLSKPVATVWPKCRFEVWALPWIRLLPCEDCLIDETAFPPADLAAFLTLCLEFCMSLCCRFDLYCLDWVRMYIVAFQESSWLIRVIPAVWWLMEHSHWRLTEWRFLDGGISLSSNGYMTVCLSPKWMSRR